MSKLYQCPYEKQCKCDLQEPCCGCETFSETYLKIMNDQQSVKITRVSIKRVIKIGRFFFYLPHWRTKLKIGRSYKAGWNTNLNK